jgi:hypothetical protein
MNTPSMNSPAMNTWFSAHATMPSGGDRATRTSRVRHLVCVVARPHSYRNIGYLLLGLPLGTVWFTVLVGGLSVGGSLLVVALLGIPMLLGMWYVVRAFANVERAVANVLLDRDIAFAPMGSAHRGNPWVRLRSMTRERDRRRELGYLMLRFPVGIATSTAAVTALTVPAAVAYAPFAARYVDDSFGDWFWSSTLHDAASSSPWSWCLVPLGLAMLLGSFQLMNALAHACGTWTATWLGSRELAVPTVPCR